MKEIDRELNHIKLENKKTEHMKKKFIIEIQNGLGDEIINKSSKKKINKRTLLQKIMKKIFNYDI